MICYPANLHLTKNETDIIAVIPPQDHADLVVLDPSEVWFYEASAASYELTQRIVDMPDGTTLRKVSLSWVSVRGTAMPKEMENYFGMGGDYVFCFRNPDGALALLVPEVES